MGEMVQAWEQAAEPAESLSTALVQKGQFGDRWLTEWRKLTGHRHGDYQYRTAYTAYKKRKFGAAQKQWMAAKNVYLGKRACKGDFLKKCKVVSCNNKKKKTGAKKKLLNGVKKALKALKAKKAKKAKKGNKAKKLALAALKEARLARVKAAPVEEIRVAGICQKKVCRYICAPKVVKKKKGPPPATSPKEQKAKNQEQTKRKIQRKAKAVKKGKKLAGLEKKSSELKSKKRDSISLLNSRPSKIEKLKIQAKMNRNLGDDRVTKARISELRVKVSKEMKLKQDERNSFNDNAAAAVKVRAEARVKQEKGAKVAAKIPMAKKKAAELQAKEVSTKFKERQAKLVHHREKQSKVQTENQRELQSKELAAKKQTKERKKKLGNERKTKDRCTVTAYDHENFMGMVVTKRTVCATRLTIEMPKSGRRRGYTAKSFKLTSGCRQVQLWDEDKCRQNYKDNVNIKSSTTDVKWNLNNDVCAITVWANRHGWCEPDAPHVHRKFEEIHSTFGGTIKR